MVFPSREVDESDLFSYVVASGDMRFIEISDRDLYLRHDPQLGLIIRGEVPECGSVCHANLSQVLLEYVMGCADCRESSRTNEAADRFGRRLGRTLIDVLHAGQIPASGIEPLQELLAIIVRSLGVPYERELNAGTLTYSLAHCPLHEAARRGALNLWIAKAHRAFVSLCETVVDGVAPEWRLSRPDERETDAPLLEITFTRT